MPPKKGGKKKRGPKTTKLTAGAVADVETSAAANASANGGAGDVPLVQDERFRSQHWDPRFARLPPRGTGGARVDDERFQFKTARKISKVDRFGRRKRTQATDDVSSEEEEEEDDAGYLGISSSDSESESDGEGEVEGTEQQQQYGRATKRVAVQGLDWNATRAMDIFACFGSFGPGLESVTIYPSKLGLKRLAAEERLGPQFLRDAERKMLFKARAAGADIEPADAGDGDEGDDSDSESEDGVVGVGVRDVEREKWRAQSALRKYEEERLQYYYAVAVFEDEESAERIYDNCDGVEYGQSRCEFSLSFVPHDMVIDTPPRDKCEKLPDGYTPPEIAPNTLSNTTVASTWDADAPDRVVLKRRILRRKEEDEDNLRAYIHSDSDGEGEEGQEEIERKRKVLLGGLDYRGEEDEEEGMVVTFNPEMLEKENENDDEQEEDRDESHWEARMRRAAERNAEKKKRRMERIKAAKGEDENPNETPATFDDPFFTEDRSEFKRAQKAAAKKRKRDAILQDPALEKEKEKQRAQLELLMADDKHAHASDDDGDEEEQGEPKKKKRTRGRRRADKLRAEDRKSSAAGVGSAGAAAKKFDVADERFTGLFESHRFALDPTHTKFKQDQTTQAIREELAKRKQEGDKQASAQDANENSKRKDDSIMALANKIKADARRAGKRRVR